MIYCTGKNCTAVDGYGHFEECKKEHDHVVHLGAGNRNTEARYRGYKGEPLNAGATDDQKAAWLIGQKARTDT